MKRIQKIISKCSASTSRELERGGIGPLKCQSVLYLQIITYQISRLFTQTDVKVFLIALEENAEKMSRG
jgi:hypothetical protein